MGWAKRTKHQGPGMRITTAGFPVRVWSQADMARELTEVFHIGRRVRRTKGELLHKPSGHGKGKWQNTRTLVAYKAKAKRRKAIASQSRAVNRAA